METEKSNTFDERIATAKNNITAMLDRIREKAPHLSNLESYETKDECECILYNDGKLEEMKRLRKQVDNYQNEDKHFTKEHRTLYGHCGKLQEDLDNIDATGRSDLKSAVDKSLDEINELIKILKTKVHSNGESCKNCDIKD